MKNKSKIINYVFLATIIGATSCSAPTLEQQSQQKIIDEIKNTSLSLPSLNTGAVSGTVKFLNVSISNGDIKVKVTRQSNIPKVDNNGRPLDTTGKEFKDSKTQTQAFLEQKGDTIANETIKRGSNSFLLSNLKPGDIAINVTSGNESFDTVAKIEAGKVTEIAQVVLGSINKSTLKTGVNIKGRVLKPDGTPVANATVSDVTKNIATNIVKTNAQGEFVLQVNSFTKPKNLEASSDGLITSISVSPDQTEELTIALIANSRSVKGKLIDSINKKPIPDMIVRSVENNSTTTTNDAGEFTLRGVSTNFGTLELGPLDGYVLTQTSLSNSTTSETTLGDIEVRPLGNVLINLIADNFPDPIDFPASIRSTVPGLGAGVDVPFTEQVNSVQAENIRCESLPAPFYYVSNPFRYLEEISGTIQIEGTNIIQQFSYPITPTVLPKPKCGIGDNKYEVTVFLNNFQLSVPINNLPGGEYTISVSLDFHETQKGIRVVIPSKDTISTELIQMRRVKRILSVGDVVGNIVVKNQFGNNLDSNAGLKVRVLALRGEVDLRDQALLKAIFSDPQSQISTTDSNDNPVANLKGAVSSFGDVDLAASSEKAAQSGQYVLKNVPTGTRVIIAGVIDTNGNLVQDYLISSYSALNVVSSTVNKAPDSIITKRVN